MTKGLHLTLMMGPVVAVPVPRDVVDALTSVQVTTSAGQRSGFQLVFAVSKDSLITKVLLPAGFFDPRTRVILMATVNGLPQVLMDGVVTRQELTPSSTPGGSKLTVTGEDVSVMMDLIDVTGFPFPAMPVEARVAVIIAKYFLYGLVPLVIPSFLQDTPIPIERIPQQNGTDLAYVQQLARDAGHVFYVEPGPLPGMNLAYWGPEVRIGLPQPALNINMDMDTNVESLTFSLDGLSRKQLVVMIQEPNTKITIPIPVPDFSILKPPLAARPALPLKVEPLRDTANKDPLRAALLGLSAASNSADAVTGTGTLDVLRYGRMLKARALVGVRGAGLAYDGLYYVKSVTHSIKRGEYKQNFSLARGGLVSITPRVIP